MSADIFSSSLLAWGYRIDLKLVDPCPTASSTSGLPVYFGGRSERSVRFCRRLGQTTCFDPRQQPCGKGFHRKTLPSWRSMQPHW